MAESAKVIGRTQSRRSRTDDEDSFSGVGTWFGQGPALLDSEVAEKALHGVDADRFVYLDPIACGLARMKTDSTHDGRKGIIFDEHVPRGLVVSRFSLVEPALDVLAGGARVVTRR
jgi:hypothetical protein